MIESVIKIIGDGRPQYGEVPYRAGENMALYPDVQKISKRNLSEFWTTECLMLHEFLDYFGS